MSKKIKEEEKMFEQTISIGSKQDLISAIQHTDESGLPRNTMKSPSQILEYIENESGETIPSLAIKAEITERELLLAIRDDSDTKTRKKIAEALNMTYYSIFGK